MRMRPPNACDLMRLRRACVPAVTLKVSPYGVRLLDRLSNDQIRYEATVDDPRTWTAPWTVAFPGRRKTVDDRRPDGLRLHPGLRRTTDPVYRIPRTTTARSTPQ